MKSTFFLSLMVIVTCYQGYSQKRKPEREERHINFDAINAGNKKIEDVNYKDTLVLIIDDVNTGIYNHQSELRNFRIVPKIPDIINSKIPISSGGQYEESRAEFQRENIVTTDKSKAMFMENLLEQIANRIDTIVTRVNKAFEINNNHKQYLKEKKFRIAVAEMITVSGKVLNSICLLYGIKSYQEKDSLINKIRHDVEEFRSSAKEYEQILNTIDPHQINGIDAIYHNYKEIVKVAGSFDEMSSALLHNIETIYLGAEAKSKYIIEPNVVKGDMIKVNLNFINRYTQDTTVKFSGKIYTKNKWSFDISTGLFGSDLKNPQYNVLKQINGTDSTSQIKNDNKNNFDLAIGALLNPAYKFASNFKIGPTAGVGVSMFDAKLQYYLGGSVIIGRDVIFSLSGGYAWSKLSQISNSIKNSETDTGELRYDFSTIPQQEQFVGSWFISLTYNIYK